MMSCRTMLLPLCALTLSSAVSAAANDKPTAPDAAPTPAQLDFFETKIRPVLVEHCYKCHSVKSEKLKGSLYVDGRDGLLHGGDSGPSIVPGDPDKSLLIQAVRYTHEDTAMPPKQKLPQPAIADLEAWVKMGAPWPNEAKVIVAKKGPDYARLKAEYWSYQPIRATAAPAVKNVEWARSDIDKFILAGLEAKELKPSSDADRATLIRRLYFDLVGLPPTPQQIDAFVADKSPDAVEKLVDQLLASPQYGERWGRHWLDVARYAESVTLRGLIFKDAWKYRDYVIEAFNTDRPFNQFMQEQIAGDLMPAETIEVKRRQMAATTFLAIGNHNLEEQDKVQLRMDVVDEQIDTFSKAFLGQTVSCARCHDHKFDPIPTADYYALAGIFRNAKTLEDANVSKWLEVPLPGDASIEKEVKAHEEAVAELQAKIKAARESMAKAPAGRVSSKDEVLDRMPIGGKPHVVAVSDLPGLVIDDADAKKVGDWKATQHVAAYVGDGYVQDLDEAKGEKTITFQPEVLPAGKYEVRLAYSPGINRAPSVPVSILSADGDKTIRINQKEVPPIDGHFVSLGQYNFDKNVGFVLVSNEGTEGYVIADAVQFIPVAELAAIDAAVEKKEIAAAKAPAAGKAVKTAADRIKAMEAQLKKLQASGPKRDTVVSVLEEAKIEDVKIHVRGSVHNLGAPVKRGYLSAVDVKNVPTPPADQSGRRELGLWLAAAENPLPARVTVNRVWHWLMGQGLVRTVDNFGTTGEAPSHPELLDYLAKQFVEQGWSIKTLIRQIVLSRTYQQQFAYDAKAAAVDPENRLLWRANRERLDGEAMRDMMLSISGQLDPTMGGQTFKPGTAADYNYKHTDVRRSVYMPMFRNSIPEMIEVFDGADPSMVSGRRNSSTVAPQSLFMLNHPFVMEQANAAADRLMKEGPTDVEARADYVYRVALGRLPTPGEKAVVVKYVNGFESNAPTAERDAWSQIFHGVFASVDFRYVN